MEQLAWYVITGLAAHRLWVLWLTQEIFRPVRERLGKIHPKVRYLVNCSTCTSVWIAAVSLALLAVPYGVILLGILAVSEVIGLIDTAMGAVERSNRQQAFRQG